MGVTPDQVLRPLPDVARQVEDALAGQGEVRRQGCVRGDPVDRPAPRLEGVQRALAVVQRLLRRRVGELEAEVTRLSAENQALLTQSLDGSLTGSLNETLADEIISLDAPRPDRSTPALA